MKRPARVQMRTCLGCRKMRPQADLLRIVRAADGSVEADPSRRGAGRGAYLCRDASCLAEAVRRARWAHAFRAPVTLSPEAAARLSRCLAADPGAGATSGSGSDGSGHQPAASTRGRSSTHGEGGW